MNAEFCKKALERIGNPNILVNLLSRRVRQLSTGGGSRPLLADTANLGSADIALRELIEEKMSWEYVDEPAVPSGPGAKKRRRSSS